MDGLMFKPVAELASLIRGGQVSARELVSVAIEHIERLNPVLNAFVEIDERVLELADAIAPRDPRPFAGVPIGVKANVPAGGLSMNFGSRFLQGHRPDHAAYLVRRLREAGFVVVGVTNMPEFGILPTTEPRHSGATRNPWNQDRTPGGSSGGSAAAVAAGMVPIAHGNDCCGAIRIPAACCGLVGLKPSRGRVSRGPDLGDSFLVADGVLSRTVAETAQLLDVLAGYEVGDSTWAPRPAEPFSTLMRRDPGRLRIAVTSQNSLDVDVDPEAMRGLHDAAELLSGLGHEVQDAAPALPGEAAADLYMQVLGPNVSLGIAYGELLAGRPPGEDEIEPLSRAIHEQALALSSTGFLAALAQLQALARGVIAFFAEYDLLMTPALAQRPPAIGEIHGWGERPLEDLERAMRFAPYSSLANVTGQPSASIPVGMGEDGLPTSVELTAKPLGEDTLLQVLAQMEAARPWAHRRPELVAT